MEDQLDDELTAASNALIDKQHILLEERVRQLDAEHKPHQCKQKVQKHDSVTCLVLHL